MRPRTIIYLAISLDGFIARENDDVSFTYPRSFSNFKKMARAAGNYVVGRRTFELGSKAKHFPLRNALTVVMTSDPSKVNNKSPGRITVTDDTPSKVIATLKKRGFGTVLLGGGTKLVSSFLKQGLVDEIYFDVMPIVLGSGKKPFDSQEKYEARLRLIDIKKFSKNEFRVHYKVQSVYKA